ncbi:MAG: phage terminase large subunit, partial [Bacteroidota bacterium]|nr:phage terminase large subunit [Bacteroidota bacterium]
QFYLPRREVLKNKLGIVQGFQDILDDKLDILTVSVVPGAGKTTLAEFFLSFYMGLYPDSFNLYVSYTGTIADMFHRSMCDIMFSGEYAWEEIFPNVKLESRSDKEKYINLNSYKPFKSLTCRSIDASMTGVTRASGIILSDDLVSGTEEAMNVQRLENLYQKYVNDAKSRRIKGCKEISIATRWSVHDPIGHFIRENEGNDRARFLAYGCYDENGESQFDYKYDKGFDTFYFKEMENVMDEITFKCLYMSDPIEREGLLYKKEELQFYLGGLPCDDEGKTKEADSILGVCDTKDVGTDFNCLLVVYGYGRKFYLEDVVYDNGSPYTLDELNANCLVRNKVQMCQFESNKEGSRTGNEVQRLVNEKGGRCSITKKYTTTNKETKIIVNSDWVKKHVVFKDPSEWTDMYKKFMQGVLSYVQMGKNKHDDGVDALAMLALYINSFESSQVEVISRASLGF